jgi:hypothetical protein
VDWAISAPGRLVAYQMERLVVGRGCEAGFALSEVVDVLEV